MSKIPKRVLSTKRLRNKRFQRYKSKRADTEGKRADAKILKLKTDHLINMVNVTLFVLV